MMNALEDELGFSILQRGHYGVKLTPGGERIIRRIRDLVNCEDALMNEIELVKCYGDNVIRIGVFSSMTLGVLPAVIERFSREFSDVTEIYRRVLLRSFTAVLTRVDLTSASVAVTRNTISSGCPSVL
ncbi:MAG: LysR family transcriptional regulator, partial [Clostridia bacterium]|nr:LysR family transcriptional regulator [Clostridia bacterium]